MGRTCVPSPFHEPFCSTQSGDSIDTCSKERLGQQGHSSLAAFSSLGRQLLLFLLCLWAALWASWSRWTAGWPKAWVNWLAEVRSFWMFTEESLCHWQSRWQRWLCVPFCRPTWKWQFASDLNIFKHFASMSGFGQKNTCTCAKLANLVSGLLPPWSHDGFHLYSSFSDYSHRNKSDHSRTI